MSSQKKESELKVINNLPSYIWNEEILNRNNYNISLEFKIEDTGIGISEENKTKVFEQFFKESPSHEGKFDGYGVGLHIVKQYLNRLKGTIVVESSAGKGTNITLVLPMKVKN